VWVCELEDCGHWWLVKDANRRPRLCASCRRAGWHKTATTGELLREKSPDFDQRVRSIVLEILAAQQPTTRPTQLQPEILPPAKPDLEALRDICVGFTDAPAPEPISHSQPCAYTEYDQDTGETYGCRLAIHPPKVKHVRGAPI